MLGRTLFPFVLVGLAGAVGAWGGPAAAEVLHHWTQFGPGSRLIARVVTDGTPCPSITVDGETLPMEQRAAPEAGFETRVCEAALPTGATKASLGDRRFPLLSGAVERIAVIGDTGCRVKGARVQACNDPVQWPFASVAGAVAKHNPDLILHLGDYHYRESECPAGADCQGSPFGDNGPTWKADWLAPAQALFAQAPLVLTRGNHEQCGWAWKGWARYLAPGPLPPSCTIIEDPWTVRLPGLELIVFDSSYGPADRSAPENLERMRRMAEATFAGLRNEAWLLTHRPLWVRYDPRGSDGDVTQRAAFADTMPDAVALVLSGHIHSFQAFDMTAGVSQVVSGNAGVTLYPAPDETVHDIIVGGDKVRMATSDSGFGFVILERQVDGRWRLDAFDVAGVLRRSCQVKGQEIACVAAASDR
jgi:predicted phosphodiesterase